MLTQSIQLVKRVTFSKVITLSGAYVSLLFFSPEIIGFFSLITAVSLIVSSTGTLRLTSAIPIMGDKSLSITVRFILPMALLSTLFGVVAAYYYTRDSYEISNYLLSSVLFTSILSKQLVEIIINHLTRMQLFQHIGHFYLLQSLSYVLLKIVLFLLFREDMNYIYAHLIVDLGIIILFSRKLWIWYNASKSVVQFQDLYSYKKFTIFQLPSQLLLIFIAQIPLFFIARNYTLEELGLFSTALMLINLPADSLVQGVGKVFIGTNVHRSKDEIFTAFVNISKKLLVFSILFLLFSDFIAYNFIENILPKRWQGLSSIFILLSPFMFVKMASAPIVSILSIIQRQELNIIINLIRLVSLMIIYSLITYFNTSFNQSLLIYSIIISVNSPISWFLIYKALKIR